MKISIDMKTVATTLTNKNLPRYVIYEAEVVKRTHSRTFRNWFKYFQGPRFFFRTFQAIKKMETKSGIFEEF